MRTLLALLVFALAVWRVAIDWMGSVAQGQALQFASMGELWGNHFPKGPGVFETLVIGYLGAGVWRYASFSLVIPVVSVLFLLGAFIWMIRRPHHVARRSIFKR